MEANPEPKLLLRHVPNLEVDGGIEEVQGHHGNLLHMLGSIADRKSAGYHICISNGLNLKTAQQNGHVFSVREAGVGVGSETMAPCY